MFWPLDWDQSDTGKIHNYVRNLVCMLMIHMKGGGGGEEPWRGCNFFSAEGPKSSFLALSSRESSLVQTFVILVYTSTLPIHQST